MARTKNRKMAAVKLADRIRRWEAIGKSWKAQDGYDKCFRKPGSLNGKK